jgi:hypothetical protein
LRRQFEARKLTRQRKTRASAVRKNAAEVGFRFRIEGLELRV